MAANAGAVYVFTRSGTTWSQRAYVKASNTEANDEFGNSVALSSDGSTLAVGAPVEDSVATGIGGARVGVLPNACAEIGAECAWLREPVVPRSDRRLRDRPGLASSSATPVRTGRRRLRTLPRLPAAYPAGI
jgi:hypothetical protein